MLAWSCFCKYCLEFLGSNNCGLKEIRYTFASELIHCFVFCFTYCLNGSKFCSSFMSWSLTSGPFLLPSALHWWACLCTTFLLLVRLFRSSSWATQPQRDSTSTNLYCQTKHSLRIVPPQNSHFPQKQKATFPQIGQGLHWKEMFLTGSKIKKKNVPGPKKYVHLYRAFLLAS